MRNKTLLAIIAILAISFLVRVWNLSIVPAGAYWDEMDVGYQAYSILKTGKDYFGNAPGFSIRSFADFRAPLVVYTAIPFITVFGVSVFSVRLPAAVFGTLSVLLIYVLTRMLFKSEKISLLAAILAGLSPWNIQYSRMAFEMMPLVCFYLGGIICFLKGLKNSKFFILSSLLFGLSLFTYNTAKLIVPITVFSLLFIYLRKKFIDQNFWIGIVILSLFLTTGFYSSIFQGGNTRFSEIAIWTDPQLDASIDRNRQASAISYTDNRDIGMKARLLDKFLYNKVTFVAEKFTHNYLQALSVDFLFISGDPNQRHSPKEIGEFYRIEFITIIFGLVALLVGIKDKDKGSIFLSLWIILAPVPAAITRDGGMHASRLFLLFPALTIVSAVGFFYIYSLISKKAGTVINLGISFIWVFGIVFFLNYYFGAYKIESAKYFQYGFPEAVKEVIDRKSGFNYVIIDDRKDSALMNYLFASRYNPSSFQAKIFGMSFNFGDFKFGNFKADKLDNLYFMKPGRRDWYTAFKENIIDDNYLLIASAEQLEEQTMEKLPGRLTENQKLLDVIFYQDGGPAFYIIESNKPKKSI